LATELELQRGRGDAGPRAMRHEEPRNGEKSREIGGKTVGCKKKKRTEEIVNWQTQMRNQINTQSSVKHSKRQRAKEQRQQMGHAMSG